MTRGDEAPDALPSLEQRMPTVSQRIMNVWPVQKSLRMRKNVRLHRSHWRG